MISLRSRLRAPVRVEQERQSMEWFRSAGWLGVALLALCAPASASRVIVDETGRRVSAPDHPHRIICLMPSLVDDVFAIGGGADVVGVIDHTERPAEASRIASVGSGLDPSLETILALHPDLVLAMAHVNPQPAIDRVARLGVPVYLVDPHGIAGLLHTVQTVGEATGREPAAAAEVARLRGRIAAVQARVSSLPRIRVFISFSSDPIFTAGRGAFITELIAVAGGESITADMAQEWPVISLEAVVARAPDALVLFRGSKVTLAGLRQRPAWEAVKAVRDDRAYYVDDRVGLSSPVAIDALEDLARQFHA